MKIPVILYCCNKEKGLNYFYSPEISADHFLKILESLGTKNPVYHHITKREWGSHCYSFQNASYVCRWVAGSVSQDNEYPAYTRMVLGIFDQEVNIEKEDVLWDILWNIDNDSLPADLAISLSDPVKKEPYNTRIADIVPRQESNIAIVSQGEKENGIKKQAASFGFLYLLSFLLIAFFLCSYFALCYIFPAASQLSDKCPFFKSSNSFLDLIKTEKEMVCPFGTPVYDGEFNKIGSVDHENDKQVNIMLFSEHTSNDFQYNQAVLHYQPRKLFSIVKLLIESTENEKIRKNAEKVFQSLKSPASDILKRVAVIIQESYPPEIQKEIFKSLADQELSTFMLAPLLINLKQLEKDLENYSWSNLLKSKRTRQIKESFIQRWSNADKLEDIGNLSLNLLGNFVFQRDVELWGSLEKVAISRLGKISQDQEVKKTIKTSLYDMMMQVSNTIELSKNDNFIEGKYTSQLQEGYRKQLDFLVKQLEKKGIPLAKSHIKMLWEKIENDTTLVGLWKASEPLFQKEMGNLMKDWVDQFFPDDASSPTHLQVLSNALMREILYGKPESVIVLVYKHNIKKEKKLPLVRTSFIEN